MRARPRWVLGIALGLLMLTFSVTTPSWAGADEPAQYVKALGMARGDVLGHEATYSDPGFTLTPATQAYLDSTTRSYSVREDEAPQKPTIPCFAFRPTVSAACASSTPAQGPSDLSYVGAYQPLYYVVPGLATWLADSPVAGLRVARLASLLVCLLLLLVALRAARRPAVVLVALPPMALFLTGTLSGSAFEVCSAVAFAVSFLALARGDRSGRGSMLAAVVAGTCLAWSRPLGGFWVVGTVVLALLAVPPSRARAVVVRHRVLLAGLAVLAAGSLVWDAALKVSSGRVNVSALPSALAHAVHHPVLTFQQEVGVFGWLDTRLPSWLYVVWAIAVVALVVVALVRGTWNQRLAVVLSIAFYLAMDAGLIAAAQGSGFPTSGRYLLPALVLLVVLSADVAFEQRIAAGLGVAVFVLGAAVGLYESGRRYAVGTHGGHLYVLRHAAWSPPGSWPVWTVVGLVALVLVAVGAGAPLRTRTP